MVGGDNMDLEFLEGLGIDEDNANKIIEKNNLELGQLKLYHIAENELLKRGAKNIGAAMKLMEIGDLEFNDENNSELIKRIDEFEVENDFLFEEKNPKPVFSRASGNNQLKNIGKEEFAKMGYIERLKLFHEDPDLYRQLTDN